MDYEIRRNDLDKLIPSLKRALGRSHELTALDLWGNIKEYSPKDHGRLAGSWELNRLGDLHSTVTTSVQYALVHETGSDPYEIFPRAAKVLRFEIDGQVIFAKSVLHQGVAATNYISGSIAQTESRLDDFVETALGEVGL